MKILVCTYIPAEFFPPTLNAVEMLSSKAKEIIILTRNLTTTPWKYPENVNVIRLGKEVDIKASEKLNLRAKIKQFLSYYITFRKLMKSFKPDVVLLYDTIPLFVVTAAIKTGLKQPSVLWYHSHDVADKKKLRKYSVGWFAAKYQHILFNKLDIFTLPSKERLPYFPIQRLKGQYFIINNYPLKRRFVDLAAADGIRANVIKLLYQGYIGEGHGLEDVIEIIGSSMEGKRIELTVIGLGNDSYKNELIDLANKKGVADFFSLLEPVAYQGLPAITFKHHIGLAIHKPVNVNFKTAGLASNKIFEYAALGLPVIVFDNKHYRNALASFSWVCFTDCSARSLMQQIENIVKNYDSFSIQARASVMEERNFENEFEKLNKVLFNVG